MPGLLGPFTWTGQGDENLGGGFRIIGIYAHINTLAEGVSVSPDGAYPRYFRQGWLAQCTDLSAVGLPSVACQLPIWIEIDDMALGFNPDASASTTTLRYSIMPGGEVAVTVFYS